MKSLIFPALLLLAGCDAGTVRRQLPERDGLVRIMEDEVKSLDPQTVSDLASMRVAADQFEGLTRFNADGEPEPGLAQSWSVSADGRVWRFVLRPSIRFSDGTPITADVFARVFARLRAEATASPTKSLFDPIATITTDGPGTVIVSLVQPFPALTELLAHPAMSALPLHRQGWASARPMVSSGAYAVQQWVLNDRIDMTANQYWQGPRPAFEKVSWRPVTDGLTAVRQVDAGQADVATEFPSARLEDLRAKHGSAIRTAPYRGTYYFAFNTRQPPFNDVRVRQALSMAVERDWMAGKLLATGVRPAWGIVPPGTSGLAGYRPEWADWSRADRMKAAAALLTKAGYGPGHPLVFDIRFNSDTDHRRVAVSLAAMWKDLGVEARMLNSEASLHFASLRRGDFALARSGWIGDLSVPENFLGVHKSNGGPINYSGYANPVFDKALNAALAEPDTKRRASAMRAAEAIAVEDAPILPLYYYVSKAFVGPRIAGWRDNIANVHPSRTITRSPNK